MAVFAIGDLHLSSNQAKPMDVFGPEWEDHGAKTKINWDATVSDEDLVIVAGDISWAMTLPEARSDLEWLAERKGTKVIVRGNHDYWWSSISQVRAALPPSIHALQNDYFSFGSWFICGTRGWLCPGEEGFDSEHDQKIYHREVKRLELSLESARSMGANKIIVALHYPPFTRYSQDSAFTALMEKDWPIEICVFGHIHDQGRNKIFQGQRKGIKYILVAADGVGFTPVLISEH